MDIADICSRLETLVQAVKGIEVGLGRLSYGDAMFPLAERPPTPSANPRPRYVPTDWPRIGGRVDLPDVSQLFASAAYRDQYRKVRAERSTRPHAPGSLDSWRGCRMPLYKVSSCAFGRLADRMRELGRDRYAAEWFCDGAYVSAPEGFRQVVSEPFVASPSQPRPTAPS